MLYNESDKTNIATFTKEGASRKYYTSFYILIQPVQEIKFMQIFFEQSDRSSHEYPEQYLYLGLPWKDYRLCTKQFLPQNYHRTFPQFREIG